MARILFFVSLIFLIAIGSVGFGMYSAQKQTSLFTTILTIRRDLWQAFNDGAALPGARPTAWTAERRYPGAGVTLNAVAPGGEALVFLQGFFEDGPEIRLIERDGTVLARWPLDAEALLAGSGHLRNMPSTNWRIDTHGFAALPDGSLIFNIDQIELFKMDRCGAVEWRLPNYTHHSVEPDGMGAFWISASRHYYQEDASPDPLYRTPFIEDTLLKVSGDGRILDEISLLEVFRVSGELGLLSLSGTRSPALMDTTRYDFSREAFHLNDVEPLPPALAADFPMFEAGDLLVSLRNRNLVLVLDPDTRQIKWWYIGKWVRQHDPDWQAGGRITIFDNNRDGTEDGAILGSSKIVEIDPATNTQRVLYGDRDGEVFHSTRRGKHQVLADGQILITEAEAGRVFQINEDRDIVWEYVNGYDADFTSRISEARAYPRDYFEIADWSCG